MKNGSFKLSAKVSSSKPEAIEPVLQRLIKKGTVRKEKDDFIIDAEIEGRSAKDLNRSLLSELRRVEKRTRLRSEWTHGNITERFFD